MKFLKINYSFSTLEHITLWSLMMKAYGLNDITIKNICSRYGCHPKMKLIDLGEQRLLKLNDFLTSSYVLGRENKQRVNENITEKINNGNIKGKLFALGLPTRGQRRHGNARSTKRTLSLYKQRKSSLR